MKETGILMTPDNHRAIRDKRKWQTRRVMVPQPSHDQYHVYNGAVTYEGEHRMWCWKDLVLDNIWDFPNGCDRKTLASRCPYGVPGDRLYVKEGVIVPTHGEPIDGCGYYMEGDRAGEGSKRLTAMHMAKRYARTWAEITDVRVQRLQEISEEDAKAEGVEGGCLNCGETPCHFRCTGRQPSYIDGFVYLWDSINRKKHPWSSNPFCWCLTFKMIRC